MDIEKAVRYLNDKKLPAMEADVIESCMKGTNIYTANGLGLINDNQMSLLPEEHANELQEKFPGMYKR